MRPTLVLVALLLALALGTTLYFSLGGTTPPPVIDAAPPGMPATDAAPVAKESALQIPSASGDSGEVARTERTNIAAPAPVATPTEKSAAGCTVVGRLVDSAGLPVAAAEVRARRGDFGFDDYETLGSSERKADPLRVVTDASGNFAIPAVKPGSVRVSVRAPGFVPLNKSGIGVPAAARLDLGELVLEASVILEGRVVNSRGIGVGGARLTRSSPDGLVTFDLSSDSETGPPPLAITSADGSFRIDQLASGPWRLRVASEEHPDKLETGLTKRPGERVPGLSFVLEDGFQIAGRVGGVPAEEIARVSVAAMPATASNDMFFFGHGDESGSSENRRRATLASDGTFVVKGLRSGSYHVQARVTDDGDAFWPRSASERVEAKSGDRGVVIDWQPGSSLTFRVVDAQSQAPIERLDVSARTRGSMAFFDAGAGGARDYPEGLVQLDDLRPRDANDRATLEISATGYRSLKMERLALNRGAKTDLGVLELERATTVDVRVVDGTHRGAIAKARVALTLVQENPGSGNFRAGGRMIRASNDGGEISYDDGDSSTARTDVDGLARLNSTPGRKGKVTVSADGYAPFTSEVFDMPEDRNVEHLIALDQGGSVEITLLSAEGEPVSGARIEHRGPEADSGPFGDPFARGKGAATDAAGQVTINNLAPGSHRFRPAKSGGGQMGEGMAFSLIGQDSEGHDWSEVEVLRGATASLVLHQPQTTEVKGVVREAGSALAGANLSLRKSGGERMFEGMEDMPFGGGGARAKSDGEGRYSFERVEPGSYELTVRHANRAMPARFSVEVDETGLEYDVSLAISIIEGRVLDSQNQPVVGAKVWAERKRAEGAGREMRAISIVAEAGDGEGMVFDSSAGMGQSRAKTDETGRYSLRGVESDVDLEVRVEAKGCEPTRSEPVSVALGQTRGGVDVTVSPAGEIKAKLVSASGKPAGPCLVHAEFLDPLPAGKTAPPQTEFAQGGSVTLKGLRPGRWKLRADPAEYFGPGEGGSTSGESREVLVVAGETAQVELPTP